MKTTGYTLTAALLLRGTPDVSGKPVRVTRTERRSKTVLSSAPALIAAVILSHVGPVYAQPPPALSRIRALAEKGNAEAQYDLGLYYDFGASGLPKSLRLAEKWYLKSAMQGNRRAQFNLAFCYRYGRNRSPGKLRLAEIWYRHSAALGYWRAEFFLAQAYKHGGMGEPHNVRLAQLWFRKSAEQKGAIRWARRMGDTPAMIFADRLAEIPGKSRSFQVIGLDNSAAHRSLPDIEARGVVENAAARPQATVVRTTSSPASHAVIARAASAGIADNQHLDQSLQLFWQAYFHDSNAKLVEFGTPALVQPVSFAGRP